MDEKIPYAEKHIEARLSQIGAALAQAAEMGEDATRLLQSAQTEIAGLYECLGDLLAEEKNADE